MESSSSDSGSDIGSICVSTAGVVSAGASVSDTPVEMSGVSDTNCADTYP